MQKSRGATVVAMPMESRAVIVKHLPAALEGEQGRAFVCELEACVAVNRPRIVLDFSAVHEPDRSMLILLLNCLEAAMKRNGDVRLASASLRTRTLLESARLHRLFEVFDTTAAAVNSFYGAGPLFRGAPAADAEREGESAA